MVNNTGFFEFIPLWAVTLLESIFITILSFVMILTVYGRFFKLYMYTAISPIPLAAAAGESTQSTAFTFIKSYAGICLEGAIIVLSCIIFSAFASSPPVVDTSASAVTMIWSCIGELIFNILVLAGTIKISDRIVREMMELQFSSHVVTTYAEILLEPIIIYILGVLIMHNVINAQKDDVFRIRMNSEIKNELEEIFAKNGLTLTDAVNVFFSTSIKYRWFSIFCN